MKTVSAQSRNKTLPSTKVFLGGVMEESLVCWLGWEKRKGWELIRMEGVSVCTELSGNSRTLDSRVADKD